MPSVYLPSISVLATVASPTGAQPMPSQREIRVAMRQIQRQLEGLTLEQRRMSGQTHQQLPRNRHPARRTQRSSFPGAKLTSSAAGDGLADYDEPLSRCEQRPAPTDCP
jgi:hypothetical protein